ncbi:MAG: ATP-dependent metallopeptidase FtsH/Yme1/Tma family protein [Planctomycetes bacterium]|nr:ATP-dependent metallopeptidase FtsH/Yme1/Tma family protein [Planctomycetota bacterium]
MFEDDDHKDGRGPGQEPRRRNDDDSGDDGSRNNKGAGFKSSRLLFLIIFVGVLIVLVASAGQQFTNRTEELSNWTEFRRRVENNEVGTLRRTGRDFYGTYSNSVPNKEKYDKFKVVGPDPFTDSDAEWLNLAAQKFNIKIEHVPPSQIPALLFSLIPWVLIVLIVYFLVFRQLRGPGGPGGVLAFGKSKHQLITKDKSKKTFKDVAGIDEAKEEVQELVGFLKNPKKFQRLGGRIPKGVLLIGPPGTGKTLLAKAIAGEADVPFFSISGSDFVEMFVGVGASRVRDLFQQAKENSPCIIFLDEIDAVGRRRGTGLGGGHDEREQTLNEILVQMDGFDSDEKIIVMAATNRPDVLDPALLRPGRFDRHVYVDLPDIRGREQILSVHSKKVKLAANADLGKLAKATPMFSGADLENLINEAALIAVTKDKEAIEQEDLEEARDKVVWGREKRSRVMDEADRWVTSYHEAGHALLGMYLPNVDKPHKVTIMPRGPSLGATHFLPEKDIYNRTRKELMGQIMVAFGGRIAEEMFVGDYSTGAKADIEMATNIARKMVCEWGMSDKLGPVKYQEDEENVFLGRELGRAPLYSAGTGELIDQEVRSLIDSSYQDAQKILEAHREDIELLAKGLMEYEVISGEELEFMLKERKLPESRKPSQAVEARPLPKHAKAAEQVRRSDGDTLGGSLPSPTPA